MKNKNQEPRTISYSTNWMGPSGMWWFRDNGFTQIVKKVLTEDNRFSGAKKGDEVEIEEITKQWYGGRIDIYGLPEDEYYCGQSEMGLPIMDGISYRNFSDWLENFESTTLLSLDELVEEFEKSYPKINWFDYKLGQRG